jgi:hypothetical protein
MEVGKNCIMRNFITCNWRILCNESFKSRRMRWAGHIAGTGEKRNA